MDPRRELLRHTIASLSYRCGKTIRDASSSFAFFQASQTTRNPVHILSHISDLLEWALGLLSGQQLGRNSTPQGWAQEVARFFISLNQLDDYLKSESPLESSVERIFQGPIADAFTHVGQLAMLRRMAGEPIRGENYFVAEIAAGKIGQNQAPPIREFS